MKIIALGSRVARRLTLMGVLFILLPLALFSFYISSLVAKDLDGLATIELQKNAKAVGMDILGQLRHVDDLLHLFISKTPLSTMDNSSSDNAFLFSKSGLENVRSLAFVNGDNSVDIIKGRTFVSSAMRAEILHKSMVDNGRSRIINGRLNGKEFQTFLVVPDNRDGEHQTRWLVAGLSNDYLFGFYERDAAELICVIPVQGVSHFCNRMPSPAWLEQISMQTRANHGPGNFLWADKKGEEQITGYWTLPLMVSFDSDRWVIAMLAASSNAANSLPDYKATVLVFGGLVVLPLFLVIIYIVRRYLSPVEQLIVASRLLANGRFDARVYLRSKDEFEELGAVFNDMAAKLGEQFFYKNILTKLSRELTECSTVYAAVAVIAAELVQLKGASAFSAITMPGIGSENTCFYLQLASSENLSMSIVAEAAPDFPVKLWSGSGVEMATAFPGLNYLCPQATATTVLLPILVDGEVKAVLAFSSESHSVDEWLSGFLLQLADLATSMYRDLSRQHQLRYQAEHDFLTGLPNRNLLRDTVTEAIQCALENNDCCGLIIFDIDRFKLINDSKGHLAGDELLRQVAERLVNNPYNFSVVSRMAGDEFVILLRDLKSVQSEELMGQAMGEILSIFDEPFSIGNWQVPVSCSVGATICPQDGTSFFELLQHADTAMYSAKSRGLGEVAFYTQALENEIQQQVEFESDLRNGLLNNQLVIHYQPVINLESKRVVGAEALVRWQHPERGLLSPFVFLGVAEKMGLLYEIGKWVLDKALDDLQRWRSQGCDLSFVAVNVSGTEFSQDTFVQNIIDTVDHHGMSPSDIELEVTETEIIMDMDNGVRKINELREAGFRIALDDFGTGYSSMEYLKMISVDKVKVDRTFVKDIEESGKDRIIVKALYTLANDMGLDIIAEGVETRAQLDFLQGQGINLIQGYYFSQPLAEFFFLEYLATFGK